VVGDEVHYLIGAIALVRFGTLRVTGATHWAVAHGMFPGMTARELLGHVLPTGYQVHGPGLPILLSIPILAGVEIARVSWLVLGALGLVIVSILASHVHPSRRWPMAAVALVATPATFLAMTQLYPDLVAGMLIAGLFLVAARMEGGWSPPSIAMVATGAAGGLLVLLHAKNLVPALLLLVALGWLCTRRPDRARLLGTLALGALPVLGFWLVYSLVAFHPGLFPKSGFAGLGVPTTTALLGLLVDAQQGLLVQQPWVVIGLAGVVVARRRAPVSTLALAVSLLVVLVANGMLANTYGGYSFVGRFEWELVAPLAALGALFVVELRHVRRRCAIGVLAAAIGVAVLEGLGLLFGGAHAFYNYVTLPVSWHRGATIGWWPGAAFLPALDARHLANAWTHPATWFGVGIVLGTAGAAFGGLLALLESRRRWRRVLLGAIAVLVVAICGIVLA
jgi:hypothetical protein